MCGVWVMGFGVLIGGMAYGRPYSTVKYHEITG